MYGYDLIWVVLLNLPWCALTYAIGRHHGTVKANKWWHEELKIRTEENYRRWR